MKGSKLFPMLAAAAALGGCAGVVKEARMRPPAAPPAAMEEVLLTGLGYSDRGSFEVAGAHGRFARGAERFEDHAFGTNEGGAGFSVEGAAVGGELSGACDFSQSDVALGSSISVTVEPLSLSCDFARDGKPIDAALELREGGETRDERRGTLTYAGQRLGLRSVHHIVGTPMPTQTPIGYVFLDGDEEVGGIDLNGGTKRIFLPRDPELREAALAASIALSVFWDPQATGLSD